MSSFNSVTLIGRLTRDPDMQFSKTKGTPVCNIGLAVDRRVKRDEEWANEPSFIEVAIWGKRGEAFAQHHKKGDLAFIDGHLQSEQFDDKSTGRKVTRVKVVADDWQFIGNSSRPRDDEGKPDQATPSNRNEVF